MQTKSDIRRDALKIRDLLDVASRIEKSLAAAQHLRAKTKNGFEFDPGSIISAFLPIRSEIDARPMMDELRQMGARLCLPVVINKTTLEFRELVRGAPLVKAGFGTAGPDDNAQVLDPQIMIVPLAAFDNYGNRIGYGAGHYDRAIARLAGKGKKPRLIGLAFDCQRVEKIAIEPHDIPLDMMLSESGLIKFK